MRSVRAAVLALMAAVILSSCSLLPFGFGALLDDDDAKADARMEQIAAAVNDNDADALTEIFSPRAVERATDLAAGVDYFLSMFPSRDLTWERSAVGAQGTTGEYEVLLAHYRAFADGQEYELTFVEFTMNEFDSDRVGVVGLGATPWTDEIYCSPTEPFRSWASDVQADRAGGNAYQVVYVPEESAGDKEELADRRMEQFGAAFEAADTESIESVFSPRALEIAVEFPQKLDGVLSLFQESDLTWKRNEVGCSGYTAFGDFVVVLWATYDVSSGGDEYELFFAEFVTNEVDPADLGIAALGVQPPPASGDEFIAWKSGWIDDVDGERGIFSSAG